MNFDTYSTTYVAAVTMILISWALQLWMDSSDLQCGDLSTGNLTTEHWQMYLASSCLNMWAMWPLIFYGYPMVSPATFRPKDCSPWCADRCIAKICCWPCNSSWRQPGNSRNEGKDHIVTNYFPGLVDIWCKMMQTCFWVREIKSLMWFMMFHVVTVVEANAG